jgi:hypothetical protein
VAFTAVNIYYTSTLEYTIKPKWLFLEDSFTKDTFDTRDDYFKDSGFGVIITCADTDLATRKQQLQMIELANDLTVCKDCEENWFIDRTLVSWYQVFQYWVSLGACRVGTTTVNLELDGTVDEAFFVPCVQAFLQTDGAVFIPNISWNSAQTKVEATWLTINVEFFDNDDVVDGMTDIRDVIDVGPGDCSMYNPELVFYDHYLQIREDIITQFLPISASILLFSSLFLSSLYKGIATLALSFSTVLAMFGIVGYGDFTQSNAIVGIAIVVAYGASVDNYLYLFALHNTLQGEDRLHQSLSRFIVPVISKFLVIICGVITLGAGPNFKQFAPVAAIFAFVNLVNALFIGTLVLKLSAKFTPKKLANETVETRAARNEMVPDQEVVEMSERLKPNKDSSIQSF